jgi:hypothetical protein
MIAHIAAVGEDRGRVIFHMGHGRLSTPALDAALHVAKAFDAAIECLFVEDQQLYDMARLPFSREVSRCGRTVTAAEPESLALDFRCDAIAAQRHVTARASSSGVPQAGRIMRDTPIDALARACAEHGPWNAIALTEAATRTGDKSLLYAALTEVTDHTGVVIAAQVPAAKSTNTTGPIAVLVETLEDLLVLLRIAERLAAVDPDTPREVVLLLATDKFEDPYAGLEAQTRLALAARDQSNMQESAAITSAPKICMVPGRRATIDTLRALRPSFFVAHFGCNFFPPDTDPMDQLAPLACPSFLVR